MLNRKAYKYVLTDREINIYDHLLQGKNITEISNELFLAKCIVATHRNSIYQKLGVKSIQQLLAHRIRELEKQIHTG